jgi:UDP-N-acetylglucosamine diphosphorylase/glucosamine-1-phosphate N-acetyltransferase
MNSIELHEDSRGEDLFPFTINRSALDIRVGILTLREKWERFFHFKASGAQNTDSPAILTSNLIPDQQLVQDISRMKPEGWASLDSKNLKKIQYPWNIFQYNAEEIRKDYDLITKDRVSQTLSQTNRLLGQADIFVEEGARVEYAFLNATTGPIYIGGNSEIMEGASIRGPFALCEGGLVKMGATIYGATTIGPYSVAGGEIKNSVIFGYSNKGHHGYLGNAVIGEWCNLGAGSSNSNLQNNAREVKIWNQPRKQFLSAGLKCGLLMGDYSRSAINTSFNTGTVTGVSCNIFGPGLTPAHIPSFSWGFSNSPPYAIEKALEDIDNWKKLKNQRITDIEIRTLTHIFEQLSKPL